jgi:hypothetical protein
LQKEGVSVKARVYHLRNDNAPLERKAENYFEIGNLLQLLEQEKI